ncbi:MAG: hypothetical protein KU37_03200 [Sulfuricurvum sp. PC08-66]|nr:MAG: hypothetical protein KU37_03200 [Sulfuricurvum sp. PC08-66]
MEVFATSRALRHYYQEALNSEGLIPKAITIGDFFSKAVIVEGYRFVTKEERTILLAKASEFERFASLHMPRELLSFIHNSHYIFRFFEELFAQGLSIDTIDMRDTYAEYEEHLAILEQLFANYTALLHDYKLMDRIIVPQHYTLNEAFFASYETFHIRIDGFLTLFELDILEQGSQHAQIILEIASHSYNQKIVEALEERFGVKIPLMHRVELDISSKKIVSSTALEPLGAIEAVGVSERVAQVGFVKQTIHDFIHLHGLRPEEIVVIVPHEEFASTLALYDREQNFNFAMGSAMTSTLFVVRLRAIIEHFAKPSMESKLRLNRLMGGYEPLIDMVRLQYEERCNMALFIKIIDAFLVSESAQVQERVHEALYAFAKLESWIEGEKLRLFLGLFIESLRNYTLDDVQGGKVTVMGVLESRGVAYRGVIVVDFNDAYAPKKSTKDIFLSSAIKEKAGLPTQKDREQLQKYFYWMLFVQAQHVAISYVENANASPSRFLYQMGIPYSMSPWQSHYTSILYPTGTTHSEPIDTFEATYDFGAQPLSASMLRTYLSCERKFYYRYIQKINEHALAEDFPDEREIGEWLHEALRQIYTQQTHFLEEEALFDALKSALQHHRDQSRMGDFMVELWLEKLRPFVAHEVARFREGYRVVACEKSLELRIGSLRLKGQIDRIDSYKGALHIIDYKSSTVAIDDTPAKVEKSVDFQLPIYARLSSSMGEVSQAAFVKLSDGTFHEEVLMDVKQERLDTILETLSTPKLHRYEKTDHRNACRYCPYVTMCW